MNTGQRTVAGLLAVIAVLFAMNLTGWHPSSKVQAEPPEQQLFCCVFEDHCEVHGDVSACEASGGVASADLPSRQEQDQAHLP